MKTSTPKPGRVENLTPFTVDTAREKGRKGGIKAAIAKREKKLLSQVYADMLAGEYGLAAAGLTLEAVVAAILARCDSSSVSMLKEIREATEGGKVAIGGSVKIIDDVPVKFVFVDPPKRQPV